MVVFPADEETWGEKKREMQALRDCSVEKIMMSDYNPKRPVKSLFCFSFGEWCENGSENERSSDPLLSLGHPSLTGTPAVATTNSSPQPASPSSPLTIPATSTTTMCPLDSLPVTHALCSPSIDDQLVDYDSSPSQRSKTTPRSRQALSPSSGPSVQTPSYRKVALLHPGDSRSS
jgi:hypothetical protein